MLVGLFGGRSDVQILNDVQYSSDLEHEHFLGPFWRNFYLGHFQNDSEGFTDPHFQVSDERANMMQHSNA